jgi:hypothetical protein
MTPQILRPIQLPPSAQVRERIEATEEELKALRRLLRASTSAERANAARQRKEALANDR